MFPSPFNDSAVGSEIIHRYLYCDECGMNPIRGVRHRCQQCPGYSLCAACFIRNRTVDSGKHWSHSFYSITKTEADFSAHWDRTTREMTSPFAVCQSCGDPQSTTCECARAQARKEFFAPPPPAVFSDLLSNDEIRRYQALRVQNDPSVLTEDERNANKRYDEMIKTVQTKLKEGRPFPVTLQWVDGAFNETAWIRLLDRLQDQFRLMICPVKHDSWRNESQTTYSVVLIKFREAACAAP